MKSLLILINRNRKMYFKDKGMFFTSLITPMILIVLYATFLQNVYKESFQSAIPKMVDIEEKLINGTVAAQLSAALLAVSCITVSFCVNLTMVQDKVNGVTKDFMVTPVSKYKVALSYFVATFLNAFIVNLVALGVCLLYIYKMGWYLSLGDIVLLILDIVLLVLFGTAISNVCCYGLKTQGQMSAVGTVISSGYGFVCGAYMPISNFSTGLQKALSYLPSTYTTSLVKNHMLSGVFKEMRSVGFSNDIVESIATSLDCNPQLFNTTININRMYLIIIVTIVLMLGMYALMIYILDRK